jgi:hypothetical protein
LPGCTDKNSCSQKEVVEINNSASGITHSVLTDIDDTTNPWIRLTIKGHQLSGTTPTDLQVEEVVNSTYFEIIKPEYTATTKTFFVTKKVGTSEQDITANSNVCNGASLTCLISPPTTSKVSFKLDPLTSYDTRYVCLKIRTLTESPTGVQVNSAASKITYKLSTDTAINLNNTSVTISTLKSAFFQTFLGNTYSYAGGGASIKSLLPSTGFFVEKVNTQDTSNPIVFYNSPSKELGRGQLTNFPSAREVKQYTITKDTTSYDKYYNANKSKIVDKSSLPSIDQINALSETSAQWRINGNLVIGNDWQNKTVVGKHIVIYTPN